MNTSQRQEELAKAPKSGKLRKKIQEKKKKKKININFSFHQLVGTINEFDQLIRIIFEKHTKLTFRQKDAYLNVKKKKSIFDKNEVRDNFFYSIFYFGIMKNSTAILSAQFGNLSRFYNFAIFPLQVLFQFDQKSFGTEEFQNRIQK